MMDISKSLFLEKFGKAFIPKKIRPYIREYFLKAGIDETPYSLFGLMFWLSALATYSIYLPFIYPKLASMNPLMFFILTFVIWALLQILATLILAFILYFYLNMRIYGRTKKLEEKLPDYLNLVSVNLKGGMSFEKALWAAIKPEFEVLAKEITIVSKSVMTGNDIREALTVFSKKYDSPVLRRSMDLLVGEIEGGGRVVDVIDSLVEDLKKTAALRRELQVATKTYMIFISSIVIFIAPTLFAVSYQLLEMITGFTQNLSGSLQNVTLPITFGQSNVSPVEFKNFSYVAITIIASFSAMIVSIIQKGDVKGGLKYLPIFVMSALLFYVIISGVISGIFSGFVI